MLSRRWIRLGKSWHTAVLDRHRRVLSQVRSFHKRQSRLKGLPCVIPTIMAILWMDGLIVPWIVCCLLRMLAASLPTHQAFNLRTFFSKQHINQLVNERMANMFYEKNVCFVRRTPSSWVASYHDSSPISVQKHTPAPRKSYSLTKCISSKMLINYRCFHQLYAHSTKKCL